VLVAFRSKAVDPAKPLSVGSLMETVADKINGVEANPKLTLSRSFHLNKTYIVVIDAGHGGTDRGSISPSSKVTEAELTLQFAKAVKAANNNPNLKIVLTRETDITNTVQEKADFANAQKADLFISLHCNDAAPIQHENGVKESNPAKGMEMYIANKEKAVNYSANAIFANELANSIKDLNHFSGIKSRNAGIWVLQAVKCPAVLIEAGFITNQEDLKLMLDAGFQKKFAAGLLEGVQSYLSSIEQNTYKTVLDTGIIKVKDSVKNNIFITVSDSIKVRESGKNPLIILDGVVQPNAEINKINPNSIERIDVLKNESATKAYGDAGKNGVIIITSKASIKDPIKITLDVPKTTMPKNVVYYLDGVKIDSTIMSKTNPNQIASVNVWKGEKAINKFGVAEGVGVVEIISKKATGNITIEDVKLEKVQVSNVRIKVFGNINGNSTVFFGDAGKSSASTEGITDLIVVNDKLVSADELNSKYKCSDFITGGAIDPKIVNGKTRKGVLYLSTSSVNLKDMQAMIEKVLAENSK
jgi:N-acetylmuramoyl-L-alanine amidase